MTIKKESRGYESYVHRVRDNIQKYVDELIQENDQLHKMIVELEEENSRYKGDADFVKEELDRQRMQRDDLRQQIERIRKEHEDIQNRYHEIERQNNDLANLYVASYRLHEALDRADVISVIQEIVINMIGSEEVAIFEREDGELKLTASHGIDIERLKSTSLDTKHIEDVRGLAEDVMRSGESFVASAEEPAPSDSKLTACLPLMLDNESIGAIAIFRLLGHKPALEPLDLELFDLLASHAAVALHNSKPHARSTAG